MNVLYYLTPKFAHLSYTLSEPLTHAWVCNTYWLVEKQQRVVGGDIEQKGKRTHGHGQECGDAGRWEL